jgi:thiamine biosynthesis protein ThiS
MLIVSRERARAPLTELAAAAVAGGVDAVQLREPGLDAAALRAAAETLLPALTGRAALLINREIDVAESLGVGVHLPERADSPATARRWLGPAALIGRSVHDARGGVAAVGADYVLAGHCFPTASHAGQPPLGLAGLRRIATAAPRPTLAVGGINAGNAGDAIRAGARGVAVIGAIVDAADPARAAADLRAAIDAALAEEGERMRSETAPAGAATIDIVVNGKPTTIPAGWNVSDFLASKRMTDAMAIVELNGTILRRDMYPSATLAAGDRMEVVHAVGGGARV